MGFFSKKTKWEKAVTKAERALAGRDHSTAYHHFTLALEGCPDEETQTITASRDECAHHLYELNLALATDSERTRDLELAAEHFQLALKFAVTEEQRSAVETALRDLETELLQEEEDLLESAKGEKTAVDKETVYNTVTGAWSEELADRYDSHGEEFKEAFVAVQTGSPQEAIGYFEKAAPDSDDGVLLYEYGCCLAALERTAEALEMLEKAEALEPDWIALKLELTRACWKEKRYDLAEEVLQRAVDVLDEVDPDVYVAVCRTAFLTENPDYGIEAADVILDTQPFDRNALLLKGQLLTLSGRDDEAITCFETAVEHYWRYDGETDRLHFDHEAGLLAVNHYMRNNANLERAEELVRALMAASSPMNRWQHEIRLGEVLIRLDRQEEAVAVLKHTTHRIPEKQTVARLRAAQLLGDDDKVNQFLEELDEDQRQAWEAARDAEDQALS